MPIDLETLKSGLLPVQEAKARYHLAAAARQEAAGVNLPPLFDAEKAAYDGYVDACMQLHGYVRGMVNVAEGRPAHKDE